MSFTAPVSRDGFAYAIDSFYAEAGNNNRHRRATIPELQALFKPSKTASNDAAKEPVAHWYEAQLLHYGLPPSKNKSTAKLRLLEAVNKGGLAVPAHIRKIEEDLKKEWLKKERGEKKQAKHQTVQSALTTAPVKSPVAKPTISKPKVAKPADAKPATKRKRDDQGVSASAVAVNVSVNVSTGPTGPTSGTPAKRPKQTARRGGPVVSKKSETSSAKKPAAPKPAAASSTAPAPARGGASVRGRGSTSTGRAKGGGSIRGKATSDTAPTPTPSAASRPKQTARRSRGWKQAMQSRDQLMNYGGSMTNGFAEEYKEEDSDINSFKEEDDDDDNMPQLQPLGLINGKYQIYSEDLNEWSGFDEDDFNLILCLDGSAVWGAYDFGMHYGIIRLPNRPLFSSHEPIPFSWRGRDNGEGEMSFGPDNHGWIRFLGGGRIEGMISCYGEARFTGMRISGNETRPPRSGASMRSEWESYNHEEYERENRARWGGSGW